MSDRYYNNDRDDNRDDERPRDYNRDYYRGDRDRDYNRGEEGFIGRVRSLFRGDQKPADERDYDRTRQWRGGQNYQQRDSRGSEQHGSRIYNQSDRYSGQGQGSYGVPYGQRSGANRGQDPDWENRNSAGYDRQSNTRYSRDFDRGENRDDRQNQGQRDLGRQSGSRSGSIYNRDWYDWDFDQDYNFENDFYRDRGGDEDYGWGQEFGRYKRETRTFGRDPESRYGTNRDQEPGYDDDRDYASRYNRDADRQGERNYGLGRDIRQDWDRGRREQGQPYGRGYESAGMNADYEGPSNTYRSAGMRSDYGQNAGYENRGNLNDDLNYRRGDVGYDSEGAFYQDLDEPINVENWEILEVAGPFRGMGPQNYRRSDERIREDLAERLTNHGRIDAHDMEVQVEDGEVTLRGTVPSREMKRLAEDTSEAIPGVKNVRNELKVNKPAGGVYPQERSQNRPAWDQSPQTNRDRQANWQDRSESRLAGENTAETTSQGGMAAASEVENKRTQILKGMEVIGKNGKVVGRVKEIRGDDFLVDRELARDVYIPFDAVKSVGAQALLDVSADEVDQQNWSKPEIL